MNPIDDLIQTEINYANGMAKVPEGPGWGIKLDDKALQQYAVDDTIIIEV